MGILGKKGLEQLTVDIESHLKEAGPELNVEDFTLDQLKKISETFDDPVNIIDLNTYEILYANKVIQQHYGSAEGKTCYAYFHRESSPCPFCTLSRITWENLGKIHIWECKNNTRNKWYLCIDRALRLTDGRIVRYEIAIDRDKYFPPDSALQNHDSMFDELFAHAPDCYCLLNEQGEFIECNNAVKRLTGFQKEELVGRNLFQTGLISFSQIPAKYLFTAKYTLKIPVGPCEIIVNHKDGRKVPAEINVFPVLVEAQPHALGVIREITDRKIEQQNLLQSEAKYKAVIEDLPALVCRFRPNGMLSFVNACYCSYFGKSIHELLGSSIFQDIRNEDMRGIVRHFCSLDKDHPMIAYEHKITAPDGSIRWLQWTGRALYDARGRLVEYQSVGRDITEQKSVVDALRKSERELKIRNRIAEIFLTVPDVEMYARVIQVIMDAMESEYGLFGYIDENESLVCSSLSRGVWGECRMTDKTIVFSPGTLGGIFEMALEKKKSTFINELLSVPEGHVPIQRALVAPIVQKRKVIGILALANKKTEYSELDRELLDTIANRISPVLHARIERDRKEQELQEKTEFNLALFNYNPVETIVVDKAGKIVKYNLAKERSGNRLPVKGEMLYKDYAASHKTDMHGELIRCIETNTVKTFPAPQYRNKVRLITISPFPKGAIVTSVDITERIKAEEALRVSEERFRDISFSIGDLIWEFDSNYKTTYMSGKSKQTLGYNADEMLGTKLFDYMPADEADRFRKYMQTIFSQKKKFADYESRMLTKDGRTISFLFSGTPVLDSNGCLAGYRGACKDITSQKNAEIMLRENEEKYRSIFENIQDVYYETTFDGKILEISPSIEKRLLYKRTELLNKSMTELFTQPDQMKEIIDMLLREGRLRDYELKLVDKDGRHKITSINSILVRNKQGRPAKIIGSMRDVTERRKLEEKLAFSEKLSMIGELSGKIAHEIGNPLHSILNCATMLNRYLELDEKDQKLMDIMISETRRLNDIISEFLKFTRIKKTVLRKQRIEPILEELVTLLAHNEDFVAKKISFKKDVEPGLPEVCVDADLIKNVFWNIFLNSVDAVEYNGYIELSIKSSQIDEVEAINIAISDNGRGIQSDVIEKIFEPYYSTKSQGSGLGLSVVKKIIDDHNGQVEVNSEVNKGTRFTIQLPLNRGM